MAVIVRKKCEGAFQGFEVIELIEILVGLMGFVKAMLLYLQEVEVCMVGNGEMVEDEDKHRQLDRSSEQLEQDGNI